MMCIAKFIIFFEGAVFISLQAYSVGCLYSTLRSFLMILRLYEYIRLVRCSRNRGVIVTLSTTMGRPKVLYVKIAVSTKQSRSFLLMATFSFVPKFICVPLGVSFLEPIEESVEASAYVESFVKKRKKEGMTLERNPSI